MGHQILITKTTYDQAILDGPNFIEANLELIPCTSLTWALQFCSVFGFDDIDGLLAGCDFIRLIMYVPARTLILYIEGPKRAFSKDRPGPPIKLERPGYTRVLARGSLNP